MTEVTIFMLYTCTPICNYDGVSCLVLIIVRLSSIYSGLQTQIT